MDIKKLITTVLAGVITLLGIAGVLTTEEATTLATSGTSAVAAVYIFGEAIVGIFKSRKGSKGGEAK